MKKIVVFLMITLLAGVTMNGCATWQGMKKDGQGVWDVAKS